jgi:hypothetical protein
MIDQQDLARTDLEVMKQAGVDVPDWLLGNVEDGDEEILRILKSDPETPAWLLEKTTQSAEPKQAAATVESTAHARIDAMPAAPQEFPKVDPERELKALTKLLTNPKLSAEQLTRVREIVQLRFSQLADKRVQ